MFYRRIGDELEIRSVTILDAAELYRLVDSDRENLGKYLPWVGGVHSVEDERYSIINTLLEPAVRLRTLPAVLLLNRKIIGSIGLSYLSLEAKKSEIGYWLHSDYAGHGYMTRAVTELQRLAFEDIGLNRVSIHVAVSNTRSRAIPERLGYTQEGIMRAALRTDTEGAIEDEVIYALLRADWKAQVGL